MLHLTDAPDTVSVTNGGSYLSLSVNGIDQHATGFEHVELDGRSGGDSFTVGDLERRRRQRR